MVTLGLFVRRQVIPKPLGSPPVGPVTSLACKVWSTWNLGCGPQGVEADDPAHMNNAVEATALQAGESSGLFPAGPGCGQVHPMSGPMTQRRDRIEPVVETLSSRRSILGMQKP